MPKLIFMIFCFSFMIAKADDSFLDLNDVSILLPLPDSKSWSLLPNGLTAGAQGELLPFAYLKNVPRLINQVSNSALYPNIKVLGIRLDPCFHEGAPPLKCKAQVRLVWQPLKLEQNDATSTFDASLHSFYELSNETFKQLINDVEILKKTKTARNDFLPLGVNPFIKQEGLAGDYTQKLLGVILKYIGQKNLSRVTFMQLFMNEKTWMFGGFDVVEQDIRPILISRLNTTFQVFNNSVSLERPFWFLGGMNPASEDPENLNILLSDSRVLSPQNEEQIIASVKAAFRFENPDFHNPGTVDCVSCHVSQPAKAWALRQYPWLQMDILHQKEIYKSDRDLRNLSPMQPHTNIVRSFGYFMNRPFVAQRTINESAAVIKYINENF